MHNFQSTPVHHCFQTVSCLSLNTQQSEAPGLVIGWTNFSVHGFCRNCQHFTGFVRKVKKNYTHLMSHKKVTIASILKVLLRFDSKDLKLDQYMKKMTLGFYQLNYQPLEDQGGQNDPLPPPWFSLNISETQRNFG